MNFELNGMEELNDQELMMVDGGRRHWKSKDWMTLGLVVAAATGNLLLVPYVA